MNTKLLKQKILDLAIRGKLTQQLKSDGTAKDLLKQISEQKRESSSTLSSPRRRGSPSAQSEKTIIPLDKSEAPFEIPANWEWVRLPDVCSIPITDGTHQTPTYSNKEEGIPFLSAKDVTTQKIVWDKIKYITKSLHEELCLRIAPQRNDILLAKNGTTGVAALVETDIVFDIYVTLAVLRPRKIINPKFLLYFVNGPVAKAQFDASLKGVGVPNLHLSEINKVILPLPPLTEQQRIVEKIQDAFAEIDSIENNKELLKNHIKQARQKILDLAIHGKLVPQNKTDEPANVLLERITRDNPHYEKMTDVPFEIPDSWEWVKLADVCKVFGRIGFRGYTKKDLVEKGMGAISLSPSNMDGMKLRFENCTYISWNKYEESPEIMLTEGDIVVVKTGSSYGKTAIVNNLPEKTTLNPQIMVLKQISCDHDYLNYFLNTSYFRKNFEELVNGTAIPTFSQEKFSCKSIPLPPLTEQKRIVDKIEETFALLDEISLHLV